MFRSGKRREEAIGVEVNCGEGTRGDEISCHEGSGAWRLVVLREVGNGEGREPGEVGGMHYEQSDR